MSTDPKTGKSSEGRKDHATLLVRDATGRQVAGLDLLEPMGYASCAEAKKGLHYRSVAIRSEGRGEQVVQGLRLPKADRETFSLRLRNGRERTYFIGTAPYGSGEGMYWRN